MFSWRCFVLGVVFFPWAAQATTYEVTNSGDKATGGTLRWAILAATSNPGVDTITFNLASTTIAPTFAGTA
ncbi:MAG: hypothetical protein V2A34_15540 [Lentisphaerota bacterium]